MSLSQTTVVNTAKRLISYDSTYDANFDALYEDSLREVKVIMDGDFPRYYNGVLNPTYTKVEEHTGTTSLFTFNVNPRLKVSDLVVVNGTEYDDIMATVLSVTKDDDEYLVELDIVFTDDDSGNVTVEYLSNYYHGHAYMLHYVLTDSFQKIHKDDVLITVKEFRDGSLSTNSQSEIMSYKNYLYNKALKFLGKAITIEVV